MRVCAFVCVCVYVCLCARAHEWVCCLRSGILLKHDEAYKWAEFFSHALLNHETNAGRVSGRAIFIYVNSWYADGLAKVWLRFVWVNQFKSPNNPFTMGWWSDLLGSCLRALNMACRCLLWHATRGIREDDVQRSRSKVLLPAVPCNRPTNLRNRTCCFHVNVSGMLPTFWVIALLYLVGWELPAFDDRVKYCVTDQELRMSLGLLLKSVGPYLWLRAGYCWAAAKYGHCPTSTPTFIRSSTRTAFQEDVVAYPPEFTYILSDHAFYVALGKNKGQGLQVRMSIAEHLEALICGAFGSIDWQAGGWRWRRFKAPSTDSQHTQHCKTSSNAYAVHISQNKGAPKSSNINNLY